MTATPVGGGQRTLRWLFVTGAPQRGVFLPVLVSIVMRIRYTLL